MTQANRDYITIVAGVPRSGTSMMMQMINAGGIPALTDNVRQADSDNPKGYYELEAVKRTKKDPAWLESAQGRSVKMVHLLLMDLPTDREYRVIFMCRDLTEVVKSQNVMLDRLGKQQGGELGKDKIIAIFKAQINKVTNWLQEQPGFRVLKIDYNEMIRNTRPLVQAINEFLGGDLDTEAMLKVVDPSLYRQRGSAGK